MPRLAAASCAALALIALCHVPTLGFGFLLWDDDLHVTQNPSVLAPGSVPLRELATTPALGYPIPVTVASYALQASLLGLSPWHFHALNLLLHVACAGLVLLVGVRLGLRPLGAIVAALVFGLHPVVAEPVSWVTGRKDVLAACFGLVALWLAWLPCSARRRAASLGAFSLGLLSKPSIAPLCVLIPLAELLFDPERERTPMPAAIRGKGRALLAYAAVLVPIALLGVLGQRSAGAIAPSEHEGAGYLRSVWYAFGHHLRLLFGLEEPTAKYLPQPWPPGFVASVDLLPLAAAAGAALLLAVLPRTQLRAASFGLMWAGLTYLPSSNLIPLARFLADSYVYLPLIGAAWCAGAAADALVLRLARAANVLRWALPALAIAACVPPLLRSQARFHDDVALWEHALQRYPHHPRVCRQWANGVAQLHGAADGLTATEMCLQRFGDALFARNKGILLGRLGRFDEARVWLERAKAGRD